MLHVDSLSQYPVCMMIQSELLARLTVAQKKDQQLKKFVLEHS